MKVKNNILKRTLSLILALSVLLVSLPIMSFMTTAAATDDNRITDPVTWNNWQRVMGSSIGTTANAGGVWTDKSVFKTDDQTLQEYFADVDGLTVDDKDNNFLVALSAMASNKSIIGYSHAVTDTILVLDISNSMRYAQWGESSSDRNDVVQPMIDATNAAITELLKLNKLNRVGVVLYSSASGQRPASRVLMPLGRYTATKTETYNAGTPNDTSDDKTINVYFETDAANGNNGDEIQVADGVINEKTKEEYKHNDVDVEGGTYIQSGIDKAMDTFLAVEDTAVEGEDFQSGSNRMPVMVLLSDGEPTYATTSYDDVGSSNLGSGSSSNARMAFATQLTAAYAKRKISEHYNNEDMLFYTLGFKVSGHAVGVLNPEEYNDTDSYWRAFLNAEDGDNVVVGAGSNGRGGTTFKKNDYITADYRYYVNDYFSADTEEGLYSAFDAIVSQIIIQSLYYPTNVTNGNVDMDGYIEFHDDIGEYMEIKSIKGTMLGDTLFTGALLARNFREGGGDLGTVDNPNDLGDNMVWAVQQRLGLDSVQDARDLIDMAYRAGQLSYTSDTEFSNYIGWYADENGEYLGFWQEGFTEDDYPNGTTPTYINKSYGMLGSVEDGHKKTDMMYVSIQVHQNIATGKTQLIWKIPSSLIPVVQYEISLEGTGLDEGEYEEDSIKVTVSDKKPIRLLYEIGLRSDINAINVAEKVASNYAYKDYYKNSKGKEGYVFFTNAWEDDEVALRQDPVHAVNTVSFFEPSFENEHYYYTENTPIWEFDGGKYTRYTGATAPNPKGVYYREFKIFEFDANGKATIKKEHEQISEYVLTEANGRIGKNDDNTWYVKPDTIHRFAQPYTYDKADNTTASLEFAHIPAVQLNDHNHYYADTILGNNGAYVLESTQGLKITKTIDVIEPNTDTNFSFKIETDLEETVALTETFETLRIDADGKETKGEIEFEIESGKAVKTVNIAANETLYILGLPDGTNYTVTELDNANYKVKSATLNGVLDTDNIIENTVTHHTIDSIAFVNTPKTSGHLIIRKTVNHPFESDPDGLADKEFEFEITVNTTQNIDGNEFDATITNGTTQDVKAKATLIESQTNLTAKNYKLTFNGTNLKLNHNEFISIEGLPLYANVTVKEINISSGFKSDKAEDTATVEIVQEENVAIRFTNNYTPDKVSPSNVTVEGNKKVTGREWLDDDEFSFTLQKLVSGTWTDLATATATKASPEFNFNNKIQREEYEKAGTYSYRVIEAKGVKGGITYDSTVYWFDIVVTDNDMDGKLEIGNVTSSNATVTKTNNDYNVKVAFDNKYAPTDAGDITINIKKTFDPDITMGKNISLAGYQFGLYAKEYDASGAFTGNWVLATTSNVTSAAGEAQIKMIYLADMLIKENGENRGSLSFDYQLKEIVPEDADKVAGVIYNTNTVYNIKVDLTDNLRGKVEAVVYIDNGNETDKDGADNKLELAEAPVIENVYDPDDAKEILTAKKTMTGRNPQANEFTFNLYKAVVSGGVWQKDGSALQTKKNDANGNVTFDELTFADIRDYTYIIEEADEGKGGIEYDTTKYYVTVTVTDNGDGTLHSEVSITNDSFVDVTAAEFTNKYTAAGTLNGFTAKKTMSGRPLQSFDIYDFELYEADSNWNTVGAAIATKANDANGNVSFDSITYDLDDLGIKRYIIKEKAGQDGNGVTCTTEEYRITVSVSDNKDGTLNAAVTSITDKNGAAKTEMEFVNTYEATGVVKVPLTATKKLEGRAWLSTDEFTFEIYKANVSGSTWTKSGTAIQTKASKTENVVFDDLEFTDDGTYYFIVTEKAGASNVGINYSTAEYHVTVKIKDNYQTGKFEFEGKTVTDASGSAADIKFTNKYSATSIYADLKASKELKGIRDLEAGEFSFELYKATVSGNTWTKNGSALQTKKNTAGGEVNFDRITYTEVGKNYYILVETQGDKGGVEYSKAEYHITVDVTDDMKGALEAETTITDKNGTTAEPKFVNFYTASGTDATFKAQKLLEGRNLQAGEFSFELYKATVSGNTWTTDGDALQTKKNGSTQSVNDILFDKINYNEPDTYYYIIKEAQGDKERVTYSEEEYHITVKVEDNKLGALETDIAVTDKDGKTVTDMIFTNIFTPKPDDITLDFNVEKTVKNIGDKQIGPDGFTFILEGDTLDEALNVTTDKDGKAKFTLSFTEGDIGKNYTYTLYEKNDGKLYTEYSTARYVYEVSVELNNDNTLSAVVMNGGEELDLIVAEFENVYDEKIPEDKPEEPKQPESPKTSDSKAIILLAVLMLLSGTAFVTLFSKAKRVNQK